MPTGMRECFGRTLRLDFHHRRLARAHVCRKKTHTGDGHEHVARRSAFGLHTIRRAGQCVRPRQRRGSHATHQPSACRARQPCRVSVRGSRPCASAQVRKCASARAPSPAACGTRALLGVCLSRRSWPGERRSCGARAPMVCACRGARDLVMGGAAARVLRVAGDAPVRVAFHQEIEETGLLRQANGRVAPMQDASRVTRGTSRAYPPGPGGQNGRATAGPMLAVAGPILFVFVFSRIRAHVELWFSYHVLVYHSTL